MEGKTAAEKAAEDATAEQEAPSWAESVGAGAAWSAVKNIVGGGGGGGHGHSHGPSQFSNLVRHCRSVATHCALL